MMRQEQQRNTIYNRNKFIKKAICATVLALITLTTQAAVPSLEELQAISTTLKEYIERGKEKGIEAALSKTSQPQYESYSKATKLTLEYLCDKNVTEDEIKNACSENPFTWSLSCISFFVHSFAVNHNRNTADFEYYFRAYTENYDYLKKLDNPSVVSVVREIGTWSPQVDKWSKWVKKGLIPQNNLEPLFSGKTSDDWLQSMDISTISLGSYLTSRNNYKDRPKFNPTKVNYKKLKAYIKSIEDTERKKLELERIKRVVKLKSIAEEIINTYGYTGTFGASKRKVTGTTTKATADSIYIKRPSGTKTTRKWHDLTLEQYLAILKGRSMGSYNSQKDVALILDWFGEYEMALTIAKKMKTQEEKDFLNKYLLDKN